MPINKSLVLTETVEEINIRRGEPTRVVVSFLDASTKERARRMLIIFPGGRVEDDRANVLDTDLPSAVKMLLTNFRTQLASYVAGLVTAAKLTDE